MARDQVQFQQIDIDSLDSEQRKAWDAYLAAKEAFKATLQSLAPQGKKIVFTEKYGTILKVALVGQAKAKAAGSKSLADYIDEQDAGGFAR